MITLCFLVLPFTYFYAEEALDSEEDFLLNYGSGDDEEDTPYSPKNKQSGGKSKQTCLGKFMDRSYVALR